MKKNRKFIKIIMFSILLLLCVCVPFLVHKNNVNAATEITDLTGITAAVPSGWTALSGYGEFSVNFLIRENGDSLENEEYEKLYIGYFVEIGFGITATPRSDKVSMVNKYDEVDEIFPDYFIIEFIDGEDIANLDLIQWLVDNNATFSGGSTPEPEPDPVYTISGQYQFNEEITWLYDTSEQEGVLYLPFYVYNHANSSRVNYDYIVNQYDAAGDNYLMYANETASGIFSGQYAGTFTTSTDVRMLAGEEIIYFYTVEVSEDVYNWLLANGQFINDPTLDPNNPDNPDSGNNPNNPNNPDFGTDTVRQIVNQVNAFLGIQILPGLSFRDILLICIALPLLIYILKVFLGG